MNFGRRIFVQAAKVSDTIPASILLIGLLAMLIAMITEHTYSAGRLGTIAFASSPPPPVGELGNSDIFVADEKFENWVRLTDDPAEDTLPDWSPDGTRIAFVSERDGNKEIYVMDADGKNQTNISKNPGPDDEPAWSPDGREIAFHTKRAGVIGIFVMEPDGKNVELVVGGAAVLGWPTWSPDGKKIAFDKGQGICVMDIVSKEQTMLTNEQAQDWWPAWSPDGAKIAFSSERDGNPEIYMMNADGTDQKRLTKVPDRDLFPDWTSDGRIIFNRASAVHIIDPDTKEQRPLSGNGVLFPDWFVPGHPGHYVEAPGKLKATWGKIKCRGK